MIVKLLRLCLSGKKVKLIPFNYQLQLSEQNLEHDENFLKMYGLLSFSQAYLSGNLKQTTTSLSNEIKRVNKVHPLQHFDLII